VYVEEGVCRYSARACLVMSVTIAGQHRVLHIFVNPRRAAGCRLVEVVGHELQHAVEVLGNPTIRSDAFRSRGAQARGWSSLTRSHEAVSSLTPFVYAPLSSGDTTKPAQSAIHV
jgi:hypothetical protein